MTARLTLATAGRVLHQIRHDHRTLALMLVVPCVLLGLLAWIYNNTPLFDLIGAPLLGLFPFLVMFLVTSIATLRERQSGTLERLLALPVGKGDFVGGYAVAFGLLAAIQAVIASTFAIYVLDLDVAGSQALLVLVAIVDALLGTASAVLSAFAATEFQAIQFFPAFNLAQYRRAACSSRATSYPTCCAGSPTCCPCHMPSTRCTRSPSTPTGEPTCRATSSSSLGSSGCS